MPGLDNLEDRIDHQVILLRVHEAEADVLVGESADIITFPDHDPPKGTMLGYLGRGKVLGKQLHQHEVGGGLIELDRTAGCHGQIHQTSLCMDRGAGILDVLGIPEHIDPGDGRKCGDIVLGSVVCAKYDMVIRACESRSLFLCRYVS